MFNYLNTGYLGGFIFFSKCILNKFPTGRIKKKKHFLKGTYLFNGVRRKMTPPKKDFFQNVNAFLIIIKVVCETFNNLKYMKKEIRKIVDFPHHPGKALLHFSVIYFLVCIYMSFSFLLLHKWNHNCFVT